MKLTRYFFSLILFLALATITQLQAQSAKELLTRKWKFDVEALMELLPEAQKEEMKKAPPEQVAMFKQMMAQSYFHFKSDGTVEMKIPVPGMDVETMKWQLTNVGKTLITIEESGKVNRGRIIELTSKKLIIEPENNEGKKERMVFIPFED